MDFNKIRPEHLRNLDYIIGIDTGVYTGGGIINSQGLLVNVKTFQIHQLLLWIHAKDKEGLKMFVIFEDARLARFDWKTPKQQAKQQGAGSVKRDGKIWEDFLTAKKIPFCAIAPNKHVNAMAKSEAVFRRTFSFSTRTSHHARIACYLAKQVFDLKKVMDKRPIKKEKKPDNSVKIIKRARRPNNNKPSKMNKPKL